MSERNHVPRNFRASMCDGDEKENDQKVTWTCKEDYAWEDKAEDFHASNIFNLQKCRDHRDTQRYMIFAVARQDYVSTLLVTLSTQLIVVCCIVEGGREANDVDSLCVTLVAGQVRKSFHWMFHQPYMANANMLRKKVAW